MFFFVFCKFFQPDFECFVVVGIYLVFAGISQAVDFGLPLVCFAGLVFGNDLTDLFFCEIRNAPSTKLGSIKQRDGAYNAPRGKVWRKNKVSRTTAKR